MGKGSFISLDAVFLFSNVPLKATVDIILKCIYDEKHKYSIIKSLVEGVGFRYLLIIWFIISLIIRSMSNLISMAAPLGYYNNDAVRKMHCWRPYQKWGYKFLHEI